MTKCTTIRIIKIFPKCELNNASDKSDMKQASELSDQAHLGNMTALHSLLDAIIIFRQISVLFRDAKHLLQTIIKGP